MELSKAKTLLAEGGYTCVLCQGETVHTSTFRGVKPLVQWLEHGVDTKGFSAADKVIGRATAYLYVLLEVREVYAQVISAPALEVLQAHGICTQYGTLVENIINRKGDGICPFEAAVMDARDADTAHAAILDKMKQINITIT